MMLFQSVTLINSIRTEIREFARHICFDTLLRRELIPDVIEKYITIELEESV